MSQSESVIDQVEERLRCHWTAIRLDRPGSLPTERQAMHLWRSLTAAFCLAVWRGVQRSSTWTPTRTLCACQVVLVPSGKEIYEYGYPSCDGKVSCQDIGRCLKWGLHASDPSSFRKEEPVVLCPYPLQCECRYGWVVDPYISFRSYLGKLQTFFTGTLSTRTSSFIITIITLIIITGTLNHTSPLNLTYRTALALGIFRHRVSYSPSNLQIKSICSTLPPILFKAEALFPPSRMPYMHSTTTTLCHGSPATSSSHFYTIDIDSNLSSGVLNVSQPVSFTVSFLSPICLGRQHWCGGGGEGGDDNGQEIGYMVKRGRTDQDASTGGIHRNPPTSCTLPSSRTSPK